MKKREPEDEQLCIAVPKQTHSEFPLDTFTIRENSSKTRTVLHNNIEIIGAMNIIEAGIGQEKWHPQGIMVTIGIEVPVTVDWGQDLELVLTEIG